MNELPFAKHERILERWVASLDQLPAVQVVWLTGSLVDGRGDRGSDIDLRIGINARSPSLAGTAAVYPGVWRYMSPAAGRLSSMGEPRSRV